MRVLILSKHWVEDGQRRFLSGVELSIFNLKNLFASVATTIYRTSDEWGEISVVDQGNFRILTFDPVYQKNSIEQSRIDLENPHKLVHEYTRAMMLVLAYIQPQHATILGVGAGCLIRGLHDIFPQCELQGVELRQQVYEVARQFFKLTINKHIKITIADAMLYLQSAADKSTNVIFADLFTAVGMNPVQIQEEFIEQCYRVLDQQGWLVVNLHRSPLLDSGLSHYLHHHFSEILICPTDYGNYILYASKSRIGKPQYFHTLLGERGKILGTKLTSLFEQMKPWRR